MAFLATPFREDRARMSPDGHWIAYGSNESGRTEVYVQPFPGSGQRVQVSTDGGGLPAWSSNGRELFYCQGDQVLAVSVTTKPAFNASKPKVLFEVSRGLRRYADYDVTPDGQHFVMVKSEKEANPTQINVVLNWFEELKRRVPPGKK